MNLYLYFFNKFNSKGKGDNQKDSHHLIKFLLVINNFLLFLHPKIIIFPVLVVEGSNESRKCMFPICISITIFKTWMSLRNSTITYKWSLGTRRCEPQIMHGSCNKKISNVFLPTWRNVMSILQKSKNFNIVHNKECLYLYILFPK